MINKKLLIIRLLILIACISMIVAGIISGEVNVVLNKAVRICLECIGIG